MTDLETRRREAITKYRNEVGGRELDAYEIEQIEQRCADHDCQEHATYILTDGPIGHGWECGVCGDFLQAG